MVYIPPSQSATKSRARSSAPKPGKYKNKIIYFQGMKFDSIGERDRYIFLLSELEAGNIRNLVRQVTYDLAINDQHICNYIADFVYFKENELIVEDFKGQITDVFKLKAKMFKACYGFDITITRRPSWRSSNALEGKSWKHS